MRRIRINCFIRELYRVYHPSLPFFIFPDIAEMFGGRQVRNGLVNMSRLILGANSIVQHSLPAILHKTDEKYYKRFNQQLETQARIFIDGFKNNAAPGLKCIEPKGAMYCMLEVDPRAYKDIKDAFDFSQKLLLEEFVFVLPGTCFRAPKYTLTPAANPYLPFFQLCLRSRSSLY